MNKNEVKKYLLINRELMAKFNRYQYGKLYYDVIINNSTFQFPISTIENGPTVNTDESGLSMYDQETFLLSSDLGTTPFDNEIKASFLNRWVDKAIDNEEFIKIL